MTKDRDYGFYLGQSVIVIDPNIKAKIIAVLNNLDGLQYQVAFWDEKIRRTEWITPSEIKSDSIQPSIISNNHRGN